MPMIKEKEKEPKRSPIRLGLGAALVLLAIVLGIYYKVNVTKEANKKSGCTEQVTAVITSVSEHKRTGSMTYYDADGRKRAKVGTFTYYVPEVSVTYNGATWNATVGGSYEEKTYRVGEEITVWVEPSTQKTYAKNEAAVEARYFACAVFFVLGMIAVCRELLLDQKKEEKDPNVYTTKESKSIAELKIEEMKRKSAAAAASEQTSQTEKSE